jgi:hypothetical protein
VKSLAIVVRGTVGTATAHNVIVVVVIIVVASVVVVTSATTVTTATVTTALPRIISWSLRR